MSLSWNRISRMSEKDVKYSKLSYYCNIHYISTTQVTIIDTIDAYPYCKHNPGGWVASYKVQIESIKQSVSLLLRWVLLKRVRINQLISLGDPTQTASSWCSDCVRCKLSSYNHCHHLYVTIQFHNYLLQLILNTYMHLQPILLSLNYFLISIQGLNGWILWLEAL